MLGSYLIFRFDDPVAKAYNERENDTDAKSSSLSEVLNELSPDFANFTSRAENLAREEVKNQRLSLELRKIYIPVVVTLATTIAAFFIGNSTNVFSIATEGFVEGEVANARSPLDAKIEELQSDLDQRVEELQSDLDQRVEALETSVNRLRAAGDALTLDERFDAIEDQIRGLQGQ